MSLNIKTILQSEALDCATQLKGLSEILILGDDKKLHSLAEILSAIEKRLMRINRSLDNEVSLTDEVNVDWEALNPLKELDALIEKPVPPKGA